MTGRAWAIGGLLAVCLATVTCLISRYLPERYLHREEALKVQLAILAAEGYQYNDRPPVYYPEFQNRILFPLLLAACSRLGILSLEEWYLLLRFASGVLAYLVFWWVLIRVGRADLKSAALGLAVLTYCLLFTYNHGWEHPTDFFDLLFTALFLWSCLGKRRWATLLLVLLASCNRESSPFAGVLWFFLRGFNEQRKWNFTEVLFAAALCCVGYGTVLGLRRLLGGNQATPSQTVAILLFPNFVYEFFHPSTLESYWPIQMVGMFLPVYLWARFRRAWRTDELFRLQCAGIVIALITATFAIMKELRVFIPSLTVLIFTCTALEARSRLASAASSPVKA
jgi:hypothetical protein